MRERRTRAGNASAPRPDCCEYSTIRSLVLAAYALGLVLVTQSGRVEIDDPELDGFIGRGHKS